MPSTARFPADARLLPLHLGDAERDAPPPALDALLRRCHPTEREIEAMLARKLAHRARPAARPPTLQQLCDQLRAFLATVIDGPFEVCDPRWFAGGASKIQMGFTLRQPLGDGPAPETPLVLRMEPAESLNATSRAREFQLLKAFDGVLPVPRIYWVDAEGRHFPEPALIYAFASGVTKPSRTRSGALSGIGTQFPAALRETLAPQFVRHLATIHTHPAQGPGFEAFDHPAVGSTQSAEWQLNRARRVWEEDRQGDLPLLELAANRLQRTLPALDRVSIVHGDYRSGNFLFDEATAEITAVLDWERGYLGDRHRDLAWTTAEQYGHWSEDGKTFLASGIAPVGELLERYEAQSGLRVDAAALRYYRVFNAYQIVVTALGSSYRVVRLSKTHQDILIAWVEAAAYGALEALRDEMERSL